MITFAFVVLSLVLFGAALYFAFRDVTHRHYADLVKLNESVDRRFESVLSTIQNHKEGIDTLAAAIQNLPKSDGSKTVPVPGPKDNFSKMEDRYAEQFKKTVVVDGIEQPTAEA